jgi:hypothetical protein
LFNRHPGYPVTQVSRDGDGVFLLRDLPPGEYRFRVDGQEKRCVLTDEQEIDGFDFVVPRTPNARSISGRVLRPDGKTPLADTEVTLTVLQAEPKQLEPCLRWLGVPRRAVTDSQGRFHLYPLKPDKYWITAGAPGYHTSQRKTVRVKWLSARALEFALQHKPTADDKE